MITQLTEDCIGITVPEGAHSFSFGFDDPHSFYYYPKDQNNIHDHRRIAIPPGSWELIGLAKDLTEDQWKGVVAFIPYGKLQRWKNYEVDSFCLSAAESGLSLLKSKSLSPDTTVIIKRKQ